MMIIRKGMFDRTMQDPQKELVFRYKPTTFGTTHYYTATEQFKNLQLLLRLDNQSLLKDSKLNKKQQLRYTENTKSKLFVMLN